MVHSPWEASSHSASQDISHFYGTGRFITVFTKACHCSLSWARCIQSTSSHPNSLMFLYYPTIYAKVWLVVSSLQLFLLKFCMHFNVPHSCCVYNPPHSPWFHRPKIIWWRIQIMKLHIMQFSSAPCYFFSLRPNILLSTLSSSTLNFPLGWEKTKFHTHSH
jgi:hypothetical protein